MLRDAGQPASYGSVEAAGGGRFAARLAALWPGLGAGTTPAWRARFLRHCEEYLEGTAWEAANRSRRFPPSPGEYVRGRRASSGSAVYLDLVEYALGPSLAPDVRGRPWVGTALSAAADVAAWHNDLVSLPKELREHEVNNLVVVLAAHRGLDPVTAGATVRAALRRRLAHFTHATERLRATCDPDSARYAAGLRAWVSGTLAWNSCADRYRSGARAGAV